MKYDVKSIIDDYEKFKSLRAVARKTTISRPTIKRILLKNDIKILSNDDAIRIANLKYEKKVYDADECSKAYLYGFVAGDVHVFKRSKFTLRAITHTTHNSFVDLFVKQFEMYGNVMCKYKEKRNEWRVMADLDYESFKFLEERRKDAVPSWINEQNFMHFLAGFIDSDGTIMMRKSGAYFQCVVRVFGQDKCVLAEIKNNLLARGFQPSFYKNFEAGKIRLWKDKIMRYNKDYYVVEIYRKEDSLRLLNSLPIQHKEKIARKKLALEIYQRKEIKWDNIKEEVISLRARLEQEALAR